MTEEVHLPQSVERIIERICLEKQQPPLKNYARKMLALIGEEAAIDILAKVLSAVKIQSFSGFVSFLVNRDFPIQAKAVLSAYDFTQASPGTQGMWSPSTASSPFNSPQPKCGNCCLHSPGSSCRTKSTSSKLHSSSPCNNGNILFEDRTPESRSPSLRHMSSFSASGECEEATKLSFEDGQPESTFPCVKNTLSFSCREENKKPISASPQLTILRKLEFRRLFLLYSYLWKQKLEDIIDVDDANEIFGLKDVSMGLFEKQIWNKYGQAFIDESERSMYLDWESGKTHLYYCHVEEDGSYYFKGPYLTRQSTHLQRMLGDENILIVKFPEDDTNNFDCPEILIGSRHYQYLVFKDEQKRGKKNAMAKEKRAASSIKCYFVRVGPDGEDDNHFLARLTISQIRSRFMHIHTVSSIRKYNARMSLILSKTVKLQVNYAAIDVKTIDDIPFQDEKGCPVFDKDGNCLIHTDGTGYISEDLAIKCQNDFLAAKYTKDNGFEMHEDFVDFNGATHQIRPPGIRSLGTIARSAPLLIQCRLFYNGSAIKGTLLVNKKLQPGKIEIRHSMIKVKRDPAFPVDKTFNSLEIVNISHRPGRTSLSKNLIALLSYGGVPREFFLNLLDSALEETRNMYCDTRHALRAACNHEGFDFGFVAKKMILCGLPLNEPYLHHCLSQLEKGEKTKLKDGKIPIDDSYYLMGTADPTGVLRRDQVCIVLESGPISGDVLVYRNPGMHFGDVHVMDAVNVKELQEFIGNAKYGIFFSTKGSSSAAYEMACGDFDGDLYFVSRNPELLKYYKKSPPWNRVYYSDSRNRQPGEFSDEQLQKELFKLFKEARTSSFDMAKSCHSWLAYMDQLLTLKDYCIGKKEEYIRKMNHLTDIYYDALDAPKSGKVVKFPKDLVAKEYPHYMGKPSSYKSSSILGQIYDRVEAFKNEDVSKKEIWKLPFFSEPIPKACVDLWRYRYDNYRKEMTDALKSCDESRNEAADDVITKYKKLLYDGVVEMEDSNKDSQDIYTEAIAIYNVVYDHAISHGNDIGKCNFAWRVAGSALCHFCAWNLSGPKETPLAVLPSLLRDLLN